MHISWFGLSAFKITTKDVTIFTDPFSKAAGVTPPRGQGHIVISSNPDNELYHNIGSISGAPFVIDGPGEYDVKGVFVRGIPTGGKNGDAKIAINRQAIFSIAAEGLLVGFLGCYREKTLNEQHVEELNNVDILLVPVGGHDTTDAETAVAILNQIEPKIIIPMHYKVPGFSVKTDPVERFLKEMGGKGETLDKLTIKKNDLEEEKTRLVLLAAQRG